MRVLLRNPTRRLDCDGPVTVRGLLARLVERATAPVPVRFAERPPP